MKKRVFHVLTPSFGPVGGVIKIFDYVLHARMYGLICRIYCPGDPTREMPLFKQSRFAGLLDDPHVSFRPPAELDYSSSDIVFFSQPSTYQWLIDRMPGSFCSSRIIHIIQNVRHKNPKYDNGWAVRLLGRPFTRIFINDQVREAVTPFLNDRFTQYVIPLGHDAGFFDKKRTGRPNAKVRVLYTTWKSRLGEKVAQALTQHDKFEFSKIDGPVEWEALRKAYHSTDVFMGTPLLEEGFYLPGLEAMAAQCLVIMPDADGNRAYCRFGRNCLQTRFESVDDYVHQLEQVIEMPVTEWNRFREEGVRTVEMHSLSIEQEVFHSVLSTLQ